MSCSLRSLRPISIGKRSDGLSPFGWKFVASDTSYCIAPKRTSPLQPLVRRVGEPCALFGFDEVVK